MTDEKKAILEEWLLAKKPEEAATQGTPPAPATEPRGVSGLAGRITARVCVHGARLGARVRLSCTSRALNSAGLP
jgi:hypothetical protein